MASYFPYCNQREKKYIRKKPWRARVKVDWVEYFLGFYQTKEEAEMVEREFKNAAI